MASLGSTCILIDANMGRLQKYLKQWSLEENTLLIFISDNGTTPAGSGKGVIGKSSDGTDIESYNAGMRGYKGSIFEGGTRVPSFWRWPGVLEPGKEINTIAAHVDVMPTLLELAGRQDVAESGFDGRSLLPLLESSNEKWNDRFLFFHRGRWPKGEEWQSFKHRFCAVRNQRFRLCNHNELYDIQNDPGETKNVAAKHPKVVADMKAEYDKWWDSVQPFLVNENVPLSKTKPFHQVYKKQMSEMGIPEWQHPELD